MASANSSSGSPNGALTLPNGIEIFKAGRAVDDSGVVHHFSEADVAGMAAAYDPALREAPLTIGHPAHDLPAYGWVGAMRINTGGRLVMDAVRVEPQFAEMVYAGRFRKRSAAFYPPGHANNPKPGHWYPRHVAFLGAQPPAIAGLKDITFADSPDGLCCFSEFNPQDHAMTDKLQAQLDTTQAQLDKANADVAAANKLAKDSTDMLAAFAEAQRKGRHDANVQFAEAALNAGLLKRPEVAQCVAVLDLVAESAPVQFAEGDTTKTVSPLDFVKARITAGKPLVQFAEHTAGGLGNGADQAINFTGKTNLTDDQLHNKAAAYAAQHNVQYAEALGKVIAFTTAA